MAEEERKEADVYTMYTCLWKALPSLIFFFNFVSSEGRYSTESCYGNVMGSKSFSVEIFTAMIWFWIRTTNKPEPYPGYELIFSGRKNLSKKTKNSWRRKEGSIHVHDVYISL